MIFADALIFDIYTSLTSLSAINTFSVYIQGSPLRRSKWFKNFASNLPAGFWVIIAPVIKWVTTRWLTFRNEAPIS
jgi:hypothetical protein